MFTKRDRSIRNIPVLPNHRGTSEHHTRGVGQNHQNSQDGETSHTHAKRSKSQLFLWGLFAVLACAVAGLLLSTLFQKADVKVTLKSQAVVLPVHITASINPSQNSLGYTRVLVKSIPQGFILVQGSLMGGQVAVLDPKILARALAQQTVAGYAGEPVALAEGSSIAASVTTSAPTFGYMLVTLTGSTTLLWQIDPQALQQALVGQNRSDFAKIVKAFGPGIAEAHLTMRPFWKLILPADASQLVVTVIQPSLNNNQN